MAVLLVVAKNQKEADSITADSKNYVSLGIEDREIYALLRHIKGYLDQIDKGCLDDFLYKLSIYGEEVLSKERVENYLNLSNVLLKEEVVSYIEDNDLFKNYSLHYNADICLKKEDYIEFANSLKTICIRALEEDKKVFVIGD